MSSETLERRDGWKEDRGNHALFVPETVPLDDMALRIPAHADMLVPISGDDELLVQREKEGREEGSMTEDERAIRRVLVGREGSTLRRTGRGRGINRGAVEVQWVAVGECLRHAGWEEKREEGT